MDISQHLDRITEFIKSCRQDYKGKTYDKELVLPNDIALHCMGTKEGTLQWQMYDDTMNLSLNGIEKEEALIEYAHLLFSQWYWIYFQHQVVARKDLRFPGRETIPLSDDLGHLIVKSMPGEQDKYWWND